MTSVIDLEAVRVRRLASQLGDELQLSGVMRVGADEVDNAARWRRAARRARRDRGWRVRTGESAG